MPELSNEEVIRAIVKWQKAAGDKALRCDNKNCWDVLEPIIAKGQVILRCVTCKALYEYMAPKLLEKILSEAKHPS